MRGIDLALDWYIQSCAIHVVDTVGTDFDETLEFYTPVYSGYVKEIYAFDKCIPQG